MAKKSSLPTTEELQQTIDLLLEKGDVTAFQADALRLNFPGQMEGSQYVLKNLGAHISIGVVFAFDVVPLPLGTIARVAWVAGAKVTELLRGNFERARVHSLGVFLIAAVPWFGYAAYLLPLRRDSRELAFLLANHTWLGRTGDTYEAFIRAKPKLIGRFARRVVPLPW